MKSVAFDEFYQRLKSRCSDKIMETTRGAEIEPFFTEKKETNVVDKETEEDRLIDRCCEAGRIVRLLQVSTNLAFLQHVTLVHDYHDFFMLSNGYRAGDPVADAAWLQAYRQIAGGIPWQEMIQSYHLLKLCKRAPRLVHTFPLSSFCSECFGPLTASPESSSKATRNGERLLQFFTERVESDPNDEKFWSTFGNDKKTYSFKIGDHTFRE